MCGLIEAFIMIVYYVISVDVFAILLSVFPLLYSYFLSEKSEESKYELNKKISSYNRKKEYAKRVFSLRDYVKAVSYTHLGEDRKFMFKPGRISRTMNPPQKTILLHSKILYKLIGINLFCCRHL